MGQSFFVAAGQLNQYLALSRANRHGLIAGATGTGKTVTLQGLAESFSADGVPVFVADVKGDLSGIAMPGSPTFKHADKLEGRAKELGMDDYAYSDNPVIFWDLYGEQGHPIGTTISEMGPLLLARLLDLNDTQEGVLQIVFRHADENGLLLLDFGDLQAMLEWAYDNAKELSGEYGNVSKQSVGAIQRQLLSFEAQGADHFFGEPALEINDFLKTDENGRGYVNVLAADKLMRSPKLYATFLLWLLAELFESLPEVGDPEKPTLVFFFDEAHLLFDDAPKALQEKIEQVVRLIRSKGVGIYFVTQNPTDIPKDVLSQLGNRVQHALRAFTKNDRDSVRAAADTFRENPAFDAFDAITDLGVGEALVSTLEKKGVPSMVDRTLIRPPRSRMGPATDKERQAVIAKSPILGVYDETIDRDSAYERLKERAKQASIEAEENLSEEEFRSGARRVDGSSYRRKTSSSNRQGIGESFAKSLVRSLGTALGRSLGNSIGGGRRRRRRKSISKSVTDTVGRQIGRSIVRGVLDNLTRGR